MIDQITIFQILILIMSVVIHELSHGYAADMLGDPTPRIQGRLTLNPFKHLDLVGSFIVPLATYLIGGFTFGWAKPVQWNPYNVKDKRTGELLISLAGPASNVLIAIVFGMIIRFSADTLSISFLQISAYIVVINLVLAIFNMVPVPPLDGSKVLFSIIPQKYIGIRETMERYSVILFFFLIFFLWGFVEPLVPIVFRLITGLGL